MTTHILIGQFDSPFVRRVAITMQFYGLPYEHRNWSVFSDYDKVIEVNPLGRVPVLQLDGQETLIESAAILDYLDEVAGRDLALMPAAGRSRRQELKRSSVALAASEKAVAIVYERHKRSAGSQDPKWSGRLREQVLSAMDWLQQNIPPLAARPSQSQLSTAVLIRFLTAYLPDLAGAIQSSSLQTLAQQCEALPEFKAVAFPVGDEVTTPQD